MNRTLPLRHAREDNSISGVPPVLVYVIFMTSLIISLISLVCVANLAARCWKRYRNRQIDARMKEIERQTTTREDDLDEEIREPPRLATELSDEEPSGAFVDVEAAHTGNEVRNKKKKKKKSKKLLEAEF